jgi:hypothetical protein
MNPSFQDMAIAISSILQSSSQLDRYLLPLFFPGTSSFKKSLKVFLVCANGFFSFSFLDFLGSSMFFLAY